jgi:hypothetical protein
MALHYSILTTRFYGARLVRYADDFVILCKGKIDAPIQMVKMVLD